MAVRFSAGTQYFSKSSPSFDPRDCTVTCWIWQNSDLGATYQSPWAAGGAYPLQYIGFQFDPSQNLNFANGVSSSAVLSSLSTQQWIFTAGVYNGSGTGTGYAAIGANALSSATASGTSDASNTVLIIGTNGYSEPMDGRVAAMKVWDRQLSQAEIEAERWYYVPISLTNLYAWYPFCGTLSDAAVDLSGQGITLTQNGSPTVEDGPPILWSPGRARAGAVAETAAPASGQPMVKRMGGVPHMNNQSHSWARRW